MEITEVEIRLVKEGRLRAYATVVLDHCLKIRDLRIIEGPDGLFVAYWLFGSESGGQGIYCLIAPWTRSSTEKRNYFTVFRPSARKSKASSGVDPTQSIDLATEDV